METRYFVAPASAVAVLRKFRYARPIHTGTAALCATHQILEVEPYGEHHGSLGILS